MKRNTIKSAVITAVGLLMLFSGLLIVKRFNLGRTRSDSPRWENRS